jgi:hypothetical protein
MVVAGLGELLAVLARKAWKSGMTDHFLQFRDHYPGFERLAEKPAIGRNLDGGQP